MIHPDCEPSSDLGYCDFRTPGCKVQHAADITAPDYVIMDCEIEETVECLLTSAWDIGQRFNANRPENGMEIAPNAYKASTPYSAIEIIRQLQNEVAVLKEAPHNRIFDAADYLDSEETIKQFFEAVHSEPDENGAYAYAALTVVRARAKNSRSDPSLPAKVEEVRGSEEQG